MDYATSFNQDIGGWEYIKCDQGWPICFKGATAFNRGHRELLGHIQVSVHMTGMFDRMHQHSIGDIGTWNTSSVLIWSICFMDASAFNQDLTELVCSQWDIHQKPGDFATSSALTEANKPIWGTCPDYNINVTASSNSDYTLAGSDRNGTVIRKRPFNNY